MSKSQLVEPIDTPTMPQVVALPAHSFSPVSSTGANAAESGSTGLQPLSNGAVNIPITPLAPPQFNPEILDEGLAGLQRQHLKLRAESIKQSSSLERVRDRLEMMCEATDRNRLAINCNAQEQQELLEDLKALGSKVKAIAIVGVSLLVAGLLLQLMMFFHMQHLLL